MLTLFLSWQFFGNILVIRALWKVSFMPRNLIKLLLSFCLQSCTGIVWCNVCNDIKHDSRWGRLLRNVLSISFHFMPFFFIFLLVLRYWTWPQFMSMDFSPFSFISDINNMWLQNVILLPRCLWGQQVVPVLLPPSKYFFPITMAGDNCSLCSSLRNCWISSESDFKLTSAAK